jgi:hypothetical protein
MRKNLSGGCVTRVERRSVGSVEPDDGLVSRRSVEEGRLWCTTPSLNRLIEKDATLKADRRVIGGSEITWDWKKYWFSKRSHSGRFGICSHEHHNKQILSK